MMFDADTLDMTLSRTDVGDRRRPGRMAAAPGLVPLLRQPSGGEHVGEDLDEAWQARDPIAPPRGIALAIALCTPIWCALGGLLYALLG